MKDFGQSGTAKAKASGLYNKLTSRTVVEFGHFLWDIVITLSELSLSLQKRDLSVAQVAAKLDGVMGLLMKYGEQ